MQFLIDNFWALTITGLTLGAVYALVALGYTLVYGVLRLINFAHSEVFMYGTFAALWVVMLLGGTAGSSTGQVIFWIAMMFVAAMAMSGLIAVLLERFAYRPLRKRNAPPLIALISAIGASFVLAEIIGLRRGSSSWVGLDDNLRSYVRNSRNARRPADIVRQGAGLHGRWLRRHERRHLRHRRRHLHHGDPRPVREALAPRPRHPGCRPGPRGRRPDGRQP